MAVRWQMMRMVAAVFVNFIYLAIVARHVSQDSFGILAIANASIALLTFFSEFGFGAALIQKDKITIEDISRTWNLSFFTSIIVALILVVASVPISMFYNEPILRGVILVLALVMLIRGVGVVSDSLLIRDLDYRKIFIADVSGLILGNLLVGSLLAISGFEVWALIGAYFAGALIPTLLKFYFRPVKLVFPKRSDLDDNLRYIIKYGFSLTGVRLFHQVAMQSDKLVLGKVMPNSVVGMYDKSMYLANVPLTYYGSAFDSVLFSAFSKFQTDLVKLKKHFFSFLLLSSALFSFLYVTFYFRAEDIILFVLGDTWSGAVELFKHLSLLIPFVVFTRFCDTYVRARNLFQKSIKVKIIYLVLVLTSLIGLYSYGIITVIFGLLGSAAIHAILLLSICIKDLNTGWNDFLGFMNKLLIVIGAVFLVNAFSNYLFDYFTIDGYGIRLIVTGVLLATLAVLVVRNIKFFLGDKIYQYLLTDNNNPLLNYILK